MAEHARGTSEVRISPEEGEPPQIGRLSGDAGVTGRLELDRRDGVHHYELLLDLAEV